MRQFLALKMALVRAAAFDALDTFVKLLSKVGKYTAQPDRTLYAR